ncbi:MAG: LacI family DNA-binding transcriptional regulator, partial [Burkholderiales bacterium]|nr:LacI family DNA-binding transcriptional regulator [Burkholderiales bacterium]
MKATVSERPRRPGASSRATGSVTLADVAKLAGVSPITVSRVVNRPELVTADTLAHVQQVIDRTGYVPNLLAGGLASKRTRLVAALVPSITNGIFVDCVQALTDRLWEAGYQVLLGLSGYPAAREDALLGAVLSRRPDAIYLTGINHSTEARSRLINAKVPVVETFDMTPTPIDMLVGFSHDQIGEAVARHLLAKGHRSFGLVWADDTRALARRQGFLAVLEAQGD